MVEKRVLDNLRPFQSVESTQVESEEHQEEGASGAKPKQSGRAYGVESAVSSEVPPIGDPTSSSWASHHGNGTSCHGCAA